MKRRITALLLLACILAGMLPMEAFAAEETAVTAGDVLEIEQIPEVEDVVEEEEIAEMLSGDEATEATLPLEEGTITDEIDSSENLEMLASYYEESEPNDSYSRADKLKRGYYMFGDIRRNAYDYFTFEVFGTYKLSFEALSARSTFRVSVVNSAGYSLGEVNRRSYGNNYKHTLTTTITPGVYYVIATDVGTISSTRYEYKLGYTLSTLPCAHPAFTQSVVAPTCGAAGKIINTCVVCGHKTSTPYGAATGLHTFGNWKTTEEARCVYKGTQIRTCSVCDKEETKSIPATGKHSFSSWELTQKANCIQQEIQIRTCSDCGKEEKKTAPKLKTHAFSDWNTTTQPTCTATGLKVRTCADCSKKESVTLDALGHDYACSRCGINADPYTGVTAKSRALISEGDKEFQVVGNTGDEATADQIYDDYIMRGYLDYSSGRHCFKFVVTEESQIVIAAMTEQNTSITLSLFDANENLLSYDSESAYSEGFYVYGIAGTLPRGTYYIALLNRGYYGVNYYLGLDIMPTEKVSCEEAGHSYACTRCGHGAGDITRIAGSDRLETAFRTADKLKDVLGVEKFDSIVIACGSNFADALAGSYLAADRKAPILLSLDNNNSHTQNLQYIRDNLSDNGTVYILGGTSAVSQGMEDLLSLSGIRCQRLMGSNRFDTNTEILKEVGVSGSEILVATGFNFADSLSASATGKPILLVNTIHNTLSESQKAYLAELTADGTKSFTIIGGTGAVSEALANELSTYGTVLRLSGSTREHTSVKVAESFFQKPDAALLAYSMNFPDGLCGGPLAYAMRAPLLLVNTLKESYAASYVRTNGITEGYILGGPNAVSTVTADLILNP